MSLKTWMEEFYPKPAPDATDSDMEAIDHSLAKWRGALKENVKKHGVVYDDFGVFDEEDEEEKFLEFCAQTCSLCHRYNSNKLRCYSEMVHNVCPIIRFRGYACDDHPNRERISTWIYARKNPKVMVELLEQTKQFLIEEETQ